MFIRVFRFALALVASLVLSASASSSFADTPAGPAPEAEETASIAKASVQPPVLQNRESIQKTLAARAAPWLDLEGQARTVRLRLEIDRDGRVRGFEIIESTGTPFLDRAVRAVVPEMRFRPALDANRPVASVVELELSLRPRQPN